MRELGRLLITLKESTGVEHLFEILRAQFFDNLVSATKIMSGYNSETRMFKANSLALLPLTSERDVYQISKFCNGMEEAKDACKKITDGRQLKLNFRRLLECVFALTLLLNRKRIGEVQFLKVETYETSVNQNEREEFSKSLSETEKKLTKNFKRVVTLGKGSKPVAILFSMNIIGILL